MRAMQLLIAAIGVPGTLQQGPGTLPELLNNIFRFLTYLVGVIGSFMMVYSGFQYVISVGRPDKTKQALQSIIYTAVGFAVAILARSLVEFIFPRVTDKYDIVPLITDSIQVFMYVIGITAVIIMIIAGMLYVYSAGDPGKTKIAKDAILYAAIGIVVALVGSGGLVFINSQLR
ncbi:hypothetical protein IT415_02640 [bacterium]|nr:hypothetical protein [bacterium]